MSICRKHNGIIRIPSEKQSVRARAFSLVELLVVIVTIAILTAIVIPTIGLSLERSRASTCTSNLHQIGAAITWYLNDWDDRYPYAWQDDYVDRGKSPALYQVLRTYALDQRLWECPSDIGETFPGDPFGWRRRTSPLWKITLARSSYVFFGAGWATRPGNMENRPASTVKKSTQTILLVEKRPWHGPYRFNETYMGSHGKYNILYCDGHVGHKTVQEWHAELESEFQP